MDAATWTAKFATALGVDAPSESEVGALLSLASVAANASERTAAPVACWLAARAGQTPAEALAAARALFSTGPN
ncbi:MAG TPA: DUF6457 domain-containing protein [Acidimicrobiales bacterium]|nr:DUF6457 domain-containing protein [Acidimicrobiales bacterium]